MRILRLKADGFGPLRGEFLFDASRLTLVVDENERGKTSLLAAIAAALYGLDRDQRSHRHVTPLDRWRPWDGGSYRVELEVDHAGERLEIRRDFAAQLVSVWDGRGRERTSEFREGKDEFPVGKHLLGLDVAEFEKCAFFRHGELDQVVPDREPERRESTLLGRLECAADTRAGDTNAIEAQHVIAEAAARYECPEASANLISVDVAVRRLELKEKTLDTDLAALEKQREDLREPLEELAATLSAEQDARARLDELERERRRARGADLATRLRHDDERRTELGALRAEADALRALPRLDAAAEAELRERCGRLEVAERHASELEARRERARAALEALEAEGRGLRAFEAHDDAAADRLAASAQELARVETELDRMRLEIESLPAHPGAGDPGGAARHVARFEALDREGLGRLQSHPEAMLAFQTRSLAAAGRKNDALTEIGRLDALRRRREIPGWLLLAVGVVGGLVAAAAWYLEMPWVPELVAGLALAGLGIFLLDRAEDGVRDERDAALAQVEAAETELATIRTEQIAGQERLHDLAGALGFGEAAELLDAWARHRAWLDARRPAEPIERQRAMLERRRDQLAAEARGLLGDDADLAPEALDIAAASIRRLVAVRGRVAGARDEARRLDDEAARNAEVISEARDRARRLFADAGLVLRSELALADQMDAALSAAARAARLVQIESELAPRIARSLLDPAAREALEREHAALAEPNAVEHDAAVGADLAGSEAGDSRTDFGDASVDGPPPSLAAIGALPTGGAVATPPTLAWIDAEIARLRVDVDALQARRAGRLARFEERAQRIQDEIAAKGAEREVIARALARARRFQSALELARVTIDEVAWETHRHWAAFLNQRVGQIVRTIATDIADVRFGEDLDFSIKLPTGLQIPRGKGAKQLSSGARDQLHFAVRIAIGEFLSKGQAPLPFLIDDCFATSDDARARAGLRLLIDHVSREHQVILVTCHRGRHEALAGMDPDLWRERVQWIDARPAQIEAPAR